MNVPLKALLPLLARRAALPPGFVRGDIGRGAFLERLGVRGREQLFALDGSLLRKRINAVKKFATRLVAALTRFGQRQQIVWPQAHVPRCVANTIAKNPRSCAPLGDLQIDIVTNRVAPALCQLGHIFCAGIFSHRAPGTPCCLHFGMPESKTKSSIPIREVPMKWG